MLTVDDYGAIRRARRDGMSIRQIAREFGHSRNTIRQDPQACRAPSRALRPGIGSPRSGACPGGHRPDPRRRRDRPAQAAAHRRPGLPTPPRRARLPRRVCPGATLSAASTDVGIEETFIPLGHLPGQRLEADFGHIHVDFPDGRTARAVPGHGLGLLQRPLRAGAALRAHRGDPRRDGRRLRVLRRACPRKSGGTTHGPSPR